MRPLVLHMQEASPPSCAVRMLAHILGLPLEFRKPSITNREHKQPEFRQLNPMGLIPVLEDGDFVISESHAIIKYLVEKYGAEQRSALYPAEQETRSTIDQCLFFDASMFFITFKSIARPALFFGSTGPTEENIKSVVECYEVCELYLQRRRYLAADHLTIADLSAASTAAAMQIVLPLDSERYPKTKEWLSRMEQEDYYQQITTPGVQTLGKLLQHLWSQNRAKAAENS